MASTANRIIKNTGYLYAKMGITMFISLYTTRLILNSLGASDFGIFNIVGGAIAMLGFLNASMASATQRFLSYAEGGNDKNRQKQIFNISIILHGILAVIIIISLLIAGWFFFNGILNIPSERYFAAKVIYGCLIVSTVLTVINVPYDAVMNAHENMKYYAFVGVFESVLKLIVALCCVYTTTDKLITYGILMMCIPFITLTIMKIYCHRRYGECVIALREYWNPSIMKEMTAFAGWNLLGSASSMITNSGVGIVMNMFFGTLINAAQGVANQICGQLMAISNMAVKAVNPVITKSAGKGDNDGMLQISETSCKVFFSLSAVVSIPAIVLMPQLLRFWLENVPPYAVFFAQCQLLIILFEQMASGFNSAINAKGVIKDSIKIRSIIKFSYLPISYLIFKSGYSVVVAYVVLILIQGCMNGLVAVVYYANKLLGYPVKRYFVNVFRPCALTFILVFGLTYCLNLLLPDSALMLMVTLCMSAVVFLVMMFLVILNKRERDVARNSLLSIKHKFIKI